ncbi:MAG TPA: hypothetical protein VM287_02550 [Egibacteraceae bacterium]|nr:hypothetical protein [Egibacteraceae bacterium]
MTPRRVAALLTVAAALLLAVFVVLPRLTERASPPPPEADRRAEHDSEEEPRSDEDEEREPVEEPESETARECAECNDITASPYNVAGDGRDQTQEIQEAVATGDDLYFPPGEYCTQTGAEMESDQTIEVREGASVLLCDRTSGSVSTFMLPNITNARVIGAGVLRDTSTASNRGADWRRSGVEIRGGSGHLVSGLTMVDFRMDGVYLEQHYEGRTGTSPEDITVRDVKTRGLARNGISVQGVDVTIDRLDCRDHIPVRWGGITGDCVFIEPNEPDQPVQGVVFNDLYSENNSSAVTIGLVVHTEDSPETDITFNNPESVGDYESYSIRNNHRRIRGRVTFNGAKSIGARERAIVHHRTNGHGFRTTFNDFHVERYGSDGGEDTQAVLADQGSRVFTPDPFGNLHVHFAEPPTRHPSASGPAVRTADDSGNGCREIVVSNVDPEDVEDDAGCVTVK